MDIVIVPFIKVLLLILDIFKWALIIYAITGWLISFSILNTHNLFVYRFYQVLVRLISPPLRLFQSFIPNIGIIDLSFLALFLSIIFIENTLYQILVKF
jgi:YggT family protein